MHCIMSSLFVCLALHESCSAALFKYLFTLYLYIYIYIYSWLTSWLGQLTKHRYKTHLVFFFFRPT